MEMWIIFLWNGEFLMEMWIICCEIVKVWWKCELFFVKLTTFDGNVNYFLWNCYFLLEMWIICGEIVNVWWECELFFVKLSIFYGSVNYFLWNCHFWWKCQLFFVKLSMFDGNVNYFLWNWPLLMKRALSYLNSIPPLHTKSHNRHDKTTTIHDQSKENHFEINKRFGKS